MRAWKPIIVYLVGALAVAAWFGSYNPLVPQSATVLYGVLAGATMLLMMLLTILGRRYLAYIVAAISWCIIAWAAPTLHATTRNIQEISGAPSGLELSFQVHAQERLILMQLKNVLGVAVSSARVTCSVRYGNGQLLPKNIQLGIGTVMPGEIQPRRVTINGEYFDPGVDLSTMDCQVSDIKQFASMPRLDVIMRKTPDAHYVFDVTNPQNAPVSRVFFRCLTSDGLSVDPGVRPLYSHSRIYNIEPGATVQLVTADAFIVRDLAHCEIVSAVWEN